MNNYLIIYKEKDEPNKFHTSISKGYQIKDIIDDLVTLEKTAGITVVQITIVS